MDDAILERLKAKLNCLDRSLVRAILHSITSTQGEISFTHTCNTCPILFGRPNSEHRKRVRSQRHRLLKYREDYPGKFALLCKYYDLDISLVSQTDIEAKEPSERSTSQQNHCMYESTPRKGKESIHLTSPVIMPADSPFSPSTSGEYIIYCSKVDFTMYFLINSAFLLKELDDEFTLDLKFPERNKSGMMAFVVLDVVSGNNVVNNLVIVKPVFDISDTSGGNKISASLLQDGSGIVIKESKIPSFFLDENYTIFSSEDDTNISRAIYRTHLTIATAVKASQRRLMKDTVCLFPGDMKCYLSFEDGEGLKLKNNLRVVEGMKIIDPTNGKTMIQHYNSFIYWTLVIQGSERPLSSEEDLKTDIMMACQRMNKLNLTKSSLM